MDFEVYCDESGLEALTNKKAHLYTAIGGIWINASDRNRLKKKTLATYCPDLILKGMRSTLERVNKKTLIRVQRLKPL